MCPTCKAPSCNLCQQESSINNNQRWLKQLLRYQNGVACETNYHSLQEVYQKHFYCEYKKAILYIRDLGNKLKYLKGKYLDDDISNFSTSKFSDLSS